MKLRIGPLFVAVLAAIVPQPAMAGEPESMQLPTRDLHARFAKGSWEFEDMFGAYFLFDRTGNQRPTFDIAIDSARFGYMLSSPRGSGFLRGNVEFLGEVFGGSVFNGPGDVLAGVSMFLRYNFVQPGARIVPYFQGGGGGVYTDYAQGIRGGNALSLSVNFNLQAIGGVRFLLNDTWSINAEASYRHISNASTSDPNYGLDQVGGALGVGFSF